MNVLVVSDVDLKDEGSGAERVLAAHSVGLARRGHTVYLIAGTRERSAKAIEEIQGVSVYRYARSLGGCLSACRLFLALARQVPFDVLLFHQPLSAFVVLLSRRSRLIPRAVVLHSPWAAEYAARALDLGSRRLKCRTLGRILRRAMERFVLAACDRVFVLSRFMAHRLEAEHPRLARRAVIVPGGVDLARFRPACDRPALRAALGLPIGSPLLLTVRNLEPRMGIDHLLRAMPKVVAAVEDVRLLIGGEGPMGPHLRRLAERLGLNGCVRFEGHLPEGRLLSLYQAADFFVLPSKQLEGFGLVAVEALACGTPVLGTPVGAIPEVLGGLEPRLVFGGADPEAIGEGISAHLQSLQADPQAYEALRARCRAYVGARFGWDRVVDQLEWELFQLARSLKRNT